MAIKYRLIWVTDGSAREYVWSWHGSVSAARRTAKSCKLPADAPGKFVIVKTVEDIEVGYYETQAT